MPKRPVPRDKPKRPVVVSARHPSKVTRPSKKAAQPVATKAPQIVRARKPKQRIPGEPIIWKKDREQE